jgi:hypothetical protein
MIHLLVFFVSGSIILFHWTAQHIARFDKAKSAKIDLNGIALPLTTKLKSMRLNPHPYPPVPSGLVVHCYYWGRIPRTNMLRPLLPLVSLVSMVY